MKIKSQNNELLRRTLVLLSFFSLQFDLYSVEQPILANI